MLSDPAILRNEAHAATLCRWTERVIYREEVLTIMGVLGDIRAELEKMNIQLGGDDGEEEEEDDA